MTQLRSCLQKEHAARLECLNKLTRTIPPQHRQAPEGRLDRQPDDLAHRLLTNRDRYDIVAQRGRRLCDAVINSLPRRPDGAGRWPDPTFPAEAVMMRFPIASMTVRQCRSQQPRRHSVPGVAFAGDVVRLRADPSGQRGAYCSPLITRPGSP